MIDQLFQFIDQNGYAYTLFSLFFFFLFLVVTIASYLKNQVLVTNTISPKWYEKDGLFIGGMLVTLLIFRLPILLFFAELNTDESMMIAEAITARDRIFFWKYIDGTTHGPLVVYPLVLTSLGGAIDYFTGRIWGFICVAGFLVFLYSTKKNLMSTRVAKLAMLPSIAFFSFTRYFDFIHYSSEHTPILILSICIYLMSCIYKNNTINNRVLLGLFMLLGSLPFTKLQVAPLAILLAVFSLLLVLKKYDYKIVRAKKQLLVILIGGLSIPFLFLISMLLTNSFGEFWRMYIMGNLSIANNDVSYFKVIGSYFEMYRWWRGYFGGVIFELTILFLLGLFLINVIKKGFTSKKKIQVFVFSLTYLIGTVVSMLKSRQVTPHYFLLLVLPASLFFSIILNEVIRAKYTYPNFKKGLKIIGLTIILFLFYSGSNYVIGFLNKKTFSDRNLFGALEKTYQEAQNDPVSNCIKQYSSKSDFVSVWGAETKYHIYSQRKMGTPYSHVAFLLPFYYPDKTYSQSFIDSYIEHFRVNEPKIFVDAVKSGNFLINDPSIFNFHQYETLSRIIKEQYILQCEYQEGDVYVRKEE